MTDLLALADRLESATAEQQGNLIGDAWDAIGPIMRPTEDQAARFARMLDAEAHESVAMMLLPEGRSWSVTDPANSDGRRSTFGYPSRCHASVEGSPNQFDYGATPALALVAAALRARHAEIEERVDG